MEKIEVTLNQATPKKHVIRYDYVYTKETLNERPAVSSLYINKEALPSNFPKSIKVTIEEVSP